ncbi:hypothetical protein A1O1_07920 [Capronia coronata CBS 617.96]|uniref:Zn(2)-C6 fungal-type domain-containing protein n=1 Tax=Capronia coronata CBS 617.96 TaxID=1182541 RepID=W9XWZ4_9EURO|nr:uncharacterized protein A1O1_07920 [Capronia coronata CBS 617.96]EXJ81855.1 hypothetical protein A1O1_07920 [Capronia coronata CBS 617.96]
MTSLAEDRRSQKRVANACRYCKKRKIKCSGIEPCHSCSQRKIACIFEEAEKKVLVSERYLLELERERRRRRSTATRSHSTGSNSRNSPRAEETVEQAVSEGQAQAGRERRQSQSLDSITNPLVSQTSSYVQDSVGRYRFLGSSSTWTFSQRAFIHLQQAFPENETIAIPLNVDGSAYQLDYTYANSDGIPDTTELPSIDYTLYLMNTVKFHTCQMLRPFDAEEFTRNLYEFSEQGVAKIESSRLWFVQFLLIVALGKAMLVVLKDPSTPPGSAWFQRAMSIMPDSVRLLREPTLAIQVLCLVTLFLMSIDMKEAAYGYIGQAARICLVEGLHQDTPRQVMGDKLANRHRDLWWTVYILDRRLSSMIGTPCSIQDVDITCPLPATDSQLGTVLNIHVKISRLMTQVQNSVYSVEHLSRPFVKIVQSTLRNMAAMAHEMETVFASASYGSIDSVSTVACHISLSYHHCILLATRPLLLHLLITQLKGNVSHHNIEQNLRPQTRHLLETSMQSARMTLKRLATLYEHHLLDAFLPFDLESAFSAAFIITLASVIVPSMVSDAAAYRSISYRIIDYLIRKGNLPARLRKKELLCLDQMIRPLLNTPGLPPRQNVGNADEQSTSFSPEFGIFGNWLAGPAESGFNPAEMLDIADQLEPQAQSTNSLDFETDWGDNGPRTWWLELPHDQENVHP